MKTDQTDAQTEEVELPSNPIVLGVRLTNWEKWARTTGKPLPAAVIAARAKLAAEG